MKYLILFIGLFLFREVAHAGSRKEITADTATIDSSRYAVLPFDQNRDSFLFDKDYKPATLSVKEVKMIEKIISVTVSAYNKGRRSIIKKPGKYYKQLIAVLNARGEKEVWVNCFCTPAEKKYWHKGVVMVLDGGPCFFNLKINLNTNTVTNWAVNGVA